MLKIYRYKVITRCHCHCHCIHENTTSRYSPTKQYVRERPRPRPRRRVKIPPSNHRHHRTLLNNCEAICLHIDKHLLWNDASLIDLVQEYIQMICAWNKRIRNVYLVKTRCRCRCPKEYENIRFLPFRFVILMYLCIIHKINIFIYELNNSI